jgi:CheY-like chemotaxis protein
MASKITVLVVDDLPDMLILLKMVLQKQGWEVIEAQDGLEALEKVQMHSPSIVLMDYNMPRMDGIEACRRIKATPWLAKTPVLIYTGAFSEGLKAEALDAGADAFLTKPLLPKDILAALERFLDARALKSG